MFMFKEPLITYENAEADLKSLFSRKHEHIDCKIIAVVDDSGSTRDEISITEVLPHHLTDKARLLLTKMTVNYIPKKIYETFPYLKSLCLSETNTQVIDDQFFDESAELRTFECRSQENLSLKASAFVAVGNLEFINFF